MRVGDNAIYVSDQKPGTYVVVDLVVISKKGFVVIYDDADGKPGSVIGNTKILPEKESRGVIAGLVRPVSHGEALFAILYEDSGDGIFSPNLDSPLRDDEGNMISMQFYIDRNASAPQDINI